MPAQTLTAKRYWWQWTDAAWWFACDQTWLLWLFKRLRTWKTWFTHGQLIVKRTVEGAANIRQLPGIFECTRQSLRHRRRRWRYIEEGGRTFEHPVSPGNKLQLSLQQISVVLLDFQSQSVAVQGRRSDIQLLDKSLFWFLLSPHEAREWSFSVPARVRRLVHSSTIYG
jgi:hypothetical protein